MIFQRLQTFRQEIYDHLGKARDAVFELMDAVLLSPSIPSLVSLSQSPIFRRKWPSIYAALYQFCKTALQIRSSPPEKATVYAQFGVPLETLHHPP